MNIQTIEIVNEQNGAKSKGAARQGLSSLTNFYCFKYS